MPETSKQPEEGGPVSSSGERKSEGPPDKGIYEGLQVLEVGPLYFALPGDFNGTVSDALRLLADYHEHPETEKKREVDEEVDGADDIPKAPELFRALWKGFLKAVDEGYRVHGLMTYVQIRGKKTVQKAIGSMGK